MSASFQYATAWHLLWIEARVNVALCYQWDFNDTVASQRSLLTSLFKVRLIFKSFYGLYLYSAILNHADSQLWNLKVMCQVHSLLIVLSGPVLDLCALGNHMSRGSKSNAPISHLCSEELMPLTLNWQVSLYHHIGENQEKVTALFHCVVLFFYFFSSKNVSFNVLNVNSFLVPLCSGQLLLATWLGQSLDDATCWWNSLFWLSILWFVCISFIIIWWFGGVLRII